MNKQNFTIVSFILVFVVLCTIAAQMDRMVSDGSHLFRNGTAFFFSANDAISILENIGQIGIKIPSFFHKSLIDLKDKYDALPTDKDDKD